MGCNCGGKSKTTVWVYTAPNGNKVTYNSETQARAAQIRGGGTYIAQTK